MSAAFRLNLPVTPPYNNDFGGDEMNMQQAIRISRALRCSRLPASHKVKKPVPSCRK
jgi:DNA-directed RNA polymerase beta' subunit